MYQVFFVITLVLLLVYCLLIWIYRRWLLRLPEFSSTGQEARTRFSVIIPARNEEDHIGNCLRSLFAQSYPAGLFEVIVINDHSTDRTEAVVHSFQQQHHNLRLLNLHELLNGKQLNAYKKKAIELAIAQSSGSWIVTTDADCTVQPEWLLLYDSYIQEKDPVFVAAPVMFRHTGTFLSAFQLLDFISLQGITAAAVSAGYHSMCNGANIAYRKDVFDKVGQFRGIDQIASGDDMLLMHKIKQAYPERLGYLFSKKAIVTTEPMYDWKSFLNQRIRWASKADKYQDRSIFPVLALVLAVNALLLLLLLWGFFEEGGWMNWLILIALKTLVELSLMIPAARFYRRGAILVWFPLMQPFHILYTVMAGWLGKFGRYQWKGRTVN
ncbi:MAG: glycosyltransferase [Bacteroidetes bacterium]|nr:glycosyltransferase [Bacteroidota bacterium]